MSINISPEVLRVIEIVGAIAGIVAILWSIVAWFLRRSEDPYLRYYIVAAIVFMPCVWLALRLPSPENQLTAVRAVFFLAGFFMGAAVLWRWVQIRSYCQAPDKYPRPIGFSHKEYLLPYFPLLGACLIALIAMIIVYTAVDPNHENRVPIFIALIALAVWGTLCRIVWQVIDDRVRRLGLADD